MVDHILVARCWRTDIETRRVHAGDVTGFMERFAQLGDDVHVGLEDNLFINHGKLASSISEQVEKIVRIIREMGLNSLRETTRGICSDSRVRIEKI